MDKHLDILAKKHLETKFIKIHGEKAPFLAEKLKIWMLPTLALIKVPVCSPAAGAAGEGARPWAARPRPGAS